MWKLKWCHCAALFNGFFSCNYINRFYVCEIKQFDITIECVLGVNWHCRSHQRQRTFLTFRKEFTREQNPHSREYNEFWYLHTCRCLPIRMQVVFIYIFFFFSLFFCPHQCCIFILTANVKVQMYPSTYINAELGSMQFPKKKRSKVLMGSEK